LMALVEPDERGDPESPLRWTTKSLRHPADELTRQGHPVSAPTVGRLLRHAGFSLQANAKTLEGAQHPDRDAQFRITGTEPRAREERIRMLLRIVGLDDHAEQRPSELSGGEQQRVAIARALARSPQLLIADEPTGQLDSETAIQVMQLLQTVVRAEGITTLVATHDAGIVDLADKVLTLEDGKLGA
jgi:ABC-type ATPase involved in cell division